MLTTSDDEASSDAPPHRYSARPDRRSADHRHHHQLSGDDSTGDDLHPQYAPATAGTAADCEPLIGGGRSRPSAVAPVDGRFPRARHILGLLGFLGFANVYAMRVNLSVAVVAMVNHTVVPVSPNGTDLFDVCPMPPNSGNGTEPSREGDFDWDERTQGIVLGSFFYGYVLTQIPGGRLAELFGGKYIYGIGVLVTAVFTLLTPLAAYSSLPALVLVRVLEGMGEGVTFPAMHAMLARWVPPLERSKFAALVYAGANFGTVVSLPLSGYLCSLDYGGGWPLAFYIFGVLGLVWFVFWVWLVYDTPETHPRIERAERAFIERSIRAHRVDDELSLSVNGHADVEPIPWRAMCGSLPLWAILVTQCGQAWAFYTQLTELPTYMKNILHMNIEQNALMSALPYLTSWMFAIGCSCVADAMLARGWITQRTSYKMWNTVASVIPSLGLIGVAWGGCDWRWVMAMLAGAGAFQGAVYPGNQMNHIALSPRFAGTMYGITNAAGNTCGFLAPYVIGMIVSGNETLTGWRTVFCLAAVVNMVGNAFYVLFASADEQPWSRQPAVLEDTEAERAKR